MSLSTRAVSVRPLVHLEGSLISRIKSSKHFNPRAKVNLAAVVADNDGVLTKTANLPIEQPNLALILWTLKAGKTFFQITGDIFEKRDPRDHEHGIRPRVTEVLRNALLEENQLAKMNHLITYCVTGRDRITYPPPLYEPRLITNEQVRMLPEEVFLNVARAAVQGFILAKKNWISEELIYKIWQEKSLDSLQNLVRLETAIDDVTINNFGNEIGIISHAKGRPNGKKVQEYTKLILNERHIKYEEPNYFWSWGENYSKVSTVRKRDIIEMEIGLALKQGVLKPGCLVIGFGDSISTDDFLCLEFPELIYLPFYLGRYEEVKNQPIFTVFNEDGRDSAGPAGFARIMKMFKEAEEHNLTLGKLPFFTMQ